MENHTIYMYLKKQYAYVYGWKYPCSYFIPKLSFCNRNRIVHIYFSLGSKALCSETKLHGWPKGQSVNSILTNWTWDQLTIIINHYSRCILSMLSTQDQRLIRQWSVYKIKQSEIEKDSSILLQNTSALRSTIFLSFNHIRERERVSIHWSTSL